MFRGRKSRFCWLMLATMMLPLWWPAAALAQSTPTASNLNYTLSVGAQERWTLSSGAHWTGSVMKLTYTIVGWPTNGTFTPDLANTPWYAGFYQSGNNPGTDSFTWCCSTGSRTSNVATCSITITTNCVPVAFPATNSGIAGSRIILMGSYTHADADSGQTLSWWAVSNPTNGSASYDQTYAVLGPAFDYYPDPGFIGTDVFEYVVCDGVSTSAPAPLTVVVTPWQPPQPAAGPPTPMDQTVVAVKNTPLNILPLYTGGGGYICWPVLVGNKPSSAAWSTNGNVFCYTPTTNWTGTASFKWRVAYSNATTPLTYSATTATCSIVVKDSGCSADWTQWRYDECRSAQSPAVLTNGLRLQWQRLLPTCAFSYCVDDPRSFFSILEYCHPVQLGKQLFVSTLANDRLTAYNTDTGVENWRYYASGALRRPPVAVALPNGTNVVIFGCDEGTVYCLNAADGSEVWKFRGAPKNYKAMGFGRLSSAWPILGSPVVYSNKVYFAAGLVPSLNLFAYCLDAATGAVQWFNDGRLSLAPGWPYSAGAPLVFSKDHSRIDCGALGGMRNWCINPATGEWSGYHSGGWSDWFYDGLVDSSGGGMKNATPTSEPQTISAGGQTFTADSLGVPGTVSCMLAGDGKLFIVTTDGTSPDNACPRRDVLYCFGGSDTSTIYYDNAVTALPATNDAWTTAVQTMLSRDDLKEGLALVWGVGSGRLVEELATQATNLMIVAADPDFNKLQALRRKMDAAGLSGARVSTLQGNPMDGGFAPYQAALIASEDVSVAGYPSAGSGDASNGNMMVKRLYKCTRPFGGEIWLPTTTDQDLAINTWLTSANLPTCSNQTSYAVTRQTGLALSGVEGFTRIKRTGFPDCEQFVHPPFRPTAHGPTGTWDTRTIESTISNAFLGASYSSIPRWGVKTSIDGRLCSGYTHDLYTWQLRTVAEADYEPPTTYNNFVTGSDGYGKSTLAIISNGLWNPLYSRYEPAPLTAVNNSSSLFNHLRYGDLATAYGSYLASATSNYWGVLTIPEIQWCWPIGGSEYGWYNENSFMQCGMVLFGQQFPNCPYGSMANLQFGLTSSDDPSDECWVNYYTMRSTHPIQEEPAQQVGISFGAPGDRYDADRKLLWTHHPAMGHDQKPASAIPPSEALPLFPVRYRGNATNIIVTYHSSMPLTVTNSTRGWISPSGVQGMDGVTIPLAQPLVAVRGTPTLPLDGTLGDACWANCPQVDLATSTNDTRTYVMLSYDATNLYVAGVLHQPGAKPSSRYMNVALCSRELAIPSALTVQLTCGNSGQQSTGLSTNDWTAAYTTNSEVFAGEMGIPWSALANAGLWTSQLVMNVEICGNILNGNVRYNQTGSTVASSLSPVYFDAARGDAAHATPHTVRLYFTEMDGWTNGQRVFDVQLQGQTVLTNFDVFVAAGGAKREVMKELPGIAIADKLTIDFVKHAGAPLLGGVEIVATGIATNLPPVPRLAASATTGPAPLDVQFSAQASSADGQIVECAWDTGDGRAARGSLLHHVFTDPGTYVVSLLVLDNHGATASTNMTITVNAGVPAAFVCNIRTNGAPGCDYSTLSTWNTAMSGASGGSDLLSTTTVFRVSATGSLLAGKPVVFTGGQTGTLRQVTSWATNSITNPYAEVAFVGGTGTMQTGNVIINGNTNYWFTIADTGTSTKSLLFTVSSTNTYLAATDDQQVVIFPGGGVGRLKHINHATPNIAFITECSGTINTGVVTCGTSGHTFTIADAGNPVITVVADCYNDWTNGLTGSASLTGAGWITDQCHCQIVRAAAGQGHTGKLKVASGAYSGFALKVACSASVPYTRIQGIIDDTAAITPGAGCSANRVLSSITAGGNGVTIANSIGPVFKVGTSKNVTFHNCTGGSFLLSDRIANQVRAVNCLAYSNAVGFTVNASSEIWLNHCVSRDGTATGCDGWKDGNVGNAAGQVVSFVNEAAGDYRLSNSDAGAVGLGQPGLGADLVGTPRTGAIYDVGAYQTIGNHAPQLQSGPTATPNPAVTGAVVQLTVGATDVDNDTLTYSWAFGDGSSGAPQTAVGINHIYNAIGIYTAKVAVSDGSLAVTGTVAVSVTVSAQTLSAFDRWRIANFGSTNAPGTGPTDDPYHCGMNNLQKYLMGMDPLNSNVVFKILSINAQAASNGVWWYGGTTNTGFINLFAVEGNTNLIGGQWTAKGSNLLTTLTGTNLWWDTNLPVALPVFYRITTCVSGP